MGPDRAGAVGVAAFQAEFHAGRHVPGAPVRLAVPSHGVEGAHEGAVGVLLTRPDMPLVQMGVQIDRARPHLPPLQIDTRTAAGSGSARHHGADLAMLDPQIDEGQPVPVGPRLHLRRWIFQQAERHQSLLEPEFGAVGGTGECRVEAAGHFRQPVRGGGRKDMEAWKSLVFPRHGALVPAAQQQVLQRRQHHEYDDAEDGEQ